jgi:hypothetical protein
MREEARELDNAPSEYFIFLEKRDLLASIGEEASARESRNGNNYYDAFKAMLLCRIFGIQTYLSRLPCRGINGHSDGSLKGNSLPSPRRARRARQERNIHLCHAR